MISGQLVPVSGQVITSGWLDSASGQLTYQDSVIMYQARLHTRTASVVVYQDRLYIRSHIKARCT